VPRNQPLIPSLVVSLIHSRLVYGNFIFVGLPAYLQRCPQTVLNAEARLTWRYLVSFARYNDLLVENREIFIPHLCLTPPLGVIPSEFCEGIWCCKTRMMDGRTDGRTDRFAISVSRVNMLTRDKNSRVREFTCWSLQRATVPLCHLANGNKTCCSLLLF